MDRRYSLAHLILAIVVVMVLTSLLVDVDAQARIAFTSDKKGDFKNYEIYVMDADGGNQQKLTNHPRNDGSPAWFVPAFAVAPAGKKFTMWGRLKQVNQ